MRWNLFRLIPETFPEDVILTKNDSFHYMK
jgi:hypothetical protein